jgi:hypothetical protein
MSTPEYPAARGRCVSRDLRPPEQGRQLMTSLVEDLHLKDLHLEDLHSDAGQPSAEEDFWRREFEYAGYGAVKRIVSGTNGWDEARREFAFRWLRDKEGEVAHREKQMQLDAARLESDIDQLRQDLARLQEDAARLLRDNAQMQRDTRQMLWGSAAAIVIAGLGLCVSMGLFGEVRRDWTAMDLLPSASAFFAGAATADANKHDQVQPPFKRVGRRRGDRNSVP